MRAQETMRQDAAFKEGIEIARHDLRQVGAGSVFGRNEESRCEPPRQAVLRGLLETVETMVNRGAVQRPHELLVTGLHAKFTA